MQGVEGLQVGTKGNGAVGAVQKECTFLEVVTGPVESGLEGVHNVCWRGAR